jgi:hypothetical protein
MSKTGVNRPDFNIVSLLKIRRIVFVYLGFFLCVMSTQNSLCGFGTLQSGRLRRCGLSCFYSAIESLDPRENFRILVI